MAKAKRPRTPSRRAKLKKAATKQEQAAVIEVPADESGRPDNAMGRPPIVFNDEDWAQFEELCGYQCTLPELAAWFDVSEDTIERQCKAKYEGLTFAEVFEQKRTAGRASLRRAMWGNAIGGHPALQIFLAKNHLGMKDKQELSTPAGEPLAMSIDHSGEVKHVTRVEITKLSLPANGWEPGGDNYTADAADTEGSTKTGAPVPPKPAERVVPDHLKPKRKRT